VVTRRELARAFVRAVRSVDATRTWYRGKQRLFTDVAWGDADLVAIESLKSWGIVPPSQWEFRAGDPADWKTLYQWSKAAGWKPTEGLNASDARLGAGSPALYRYEMAIQLWYVIKDRQEAFPAAPGYLSRGSDADGDGIADLDDALPFDRNNNSVPDLIDPAERS
jgi:hypothetical protein